MTQALECLLEGEAGLSRGDLTEAERRLLEPLLPQERGRKSWPAFNNRAIQLARKSYSFMSFYLLFARVPAGAFFFNLL